MNKKIIAIGLSLTLVLSLHAIQPGEKSAVRQASKKAIPQLNISRQTGVTAYNARSEVIPLGEPVGRRVFRTNSRGTVDTLDWGVPGDANFGFFPGDVFMEVFKAPTELTMYGVGVDIYVWNADGFTPSLKVEVWRPGTGGYPYRTDGTNYPSTMTNAAGWAGYAHPADNDTLAYPDTSAAAPVWNSFANGGTCGGDAEPTNGQPLMGTKVLPSGWTDYTITNDATLGLHWVDFTEEGGADFVTDEYIAVVVTYLETGAGDPADGDARIGIYAGSQTSIHPSPAVKFYATNCDGSGGETGWYIRGYSWKFFFAVELTGDRGPVFTDIDAVPTTLSIEDRTFGCDVTDDNPSGGTAGVAGVTLSYQLDSLTAPVNTVSFAMTAGTDVDGTWGGTIPGQAIGTGVYWWLTAIDVGGNSTDSPTVFYTIFEPTAGLPLVYNNQEVSGIEDYLDWTASYDVWESAFGDVSAELLVHYDVLIEMAGDGPDNYAAAADDAIAAWWGGDKTYIVSSDEWLGARTGWENTTYAAGDLPYDIFGIAADYNDVNYAGSGDAAGVSRLTAVAGDAVGGALATFLSDSSLSLNYDPTSEMAGSNWLDGIDAVEGYTVAMNGFVGILDSLSQADPDTTSYAVAIYGQAGNGGKSAFMAFDVEALNTAPDYFWVGAPYYNDWLAANHPTYTTGFLPTVLVNPLLASIAWAEGVVGTGNEASVPSRFELKGNYPNPFNPTTSIVYVIDTRADVSVTVYNMLGQQIANLFNGNVTPGSHEILWNGIDNTGHSVASGVYFYRVEAVGQTLTGKMMLLK